MERKSRGPTQTHYTSTTSPQITPEKLGELGFDGTEVSRLEAYKQAYNPISDFFDTNSEWINLLFMKWECEHGAYEDYPRERWKDNRLEYRWNDDVPEPQHLAEIDQAYELPEGTPTYVR